VAQRRAGAPRRRVSDRRLRRARGPTKH
jgi:hypothetical protein